MQTQTRIPDQNPSGRASEQDELIVAHIPLVRHVAMRIHRSTGSSLELDDLVSAGTVGLLEAARGFEPERGLAFTTFAVPRIRGAILDELRAADPASRSVRSRQKSIDSARETLAGRLAREPRHGEVAEELGVDQDRLWSWRQDVERTMTLPLDGPAGREAGGVTLSAVLSDPEAEGIDAALGRRDDVARVREAILSLADRHRVVLSLYYFEELTLREVGEVIGVTESRVSQLRSEALKILRARLAPVL